MKVTQVFTDSVCYLPYIHDTEAFLDKGHIDYEQWVHEDQFELRIGTISSKQLKQLCKFFAIYNIPIDTAIIIYR